MGKPVCFTDINLIHRSPNKDELILKSWLFRLESLEKLEFF